MAKWKPDFKIAGISVPVPDNYSQVVIDLSTDETGRTLDGEFHKDVVAVKMSVPLEWSALEWSVASQIANAVDGKESITCEYIDVRNPYKMSKKTVYIGDRAFEPVRFDSDGKVYWSVKFNKIEV